MKKIKFVVLAVSVLLAIGALILINQTARQIRISEQEKVKLWASAISQKGQLVEYTEDFFKAVEAEEQRKMELYVKAQKTLINGTNLEMGLEIISNNHTIPVIITDENLNITSFNNVEIPDSVKVLSGKLLEEFSQIEPIPYKVWGMNFILFYKESYIYTELRSVLDELNETFLTEITQNSVNVPVIIVDSLQGHVLGSGNINEREFNSPERLSNKLCEMEEENPPIEIRIPNNCRAYIFYEKTPLLKMLGWVPLAYLFIAIILILISYNLFRTARTMEQNKVWVGLAKETAHQLGTPISSLIAWTEYLQGKTLNEEYTVEIKKDLDRLETITHRFSKIGSNPELKPCDLNNIINQTVQYLQSRTSKKVKFVVNTPDEPLMLPINNYLFEWVIENLCKNAIDAMNGSGTITIIASQDAKHIYIDIGDTGKGIPYSIQKKIFESGYTTKQRGWGLGLSLAKRIIEEYHGGRIFLKYSIIGQGSVFRIELHHAETNTK